MCLPFGKKRFSRHKNQRPQGVQLEHLDDRRARNPRPSTRVRAPHLTAPPPSPANGQPTVTMVPSEPEKISIPDHARQRRDDDARLEEQEDFETDSDESPRAPDATFALPERTSSLDASTFNKLEKRKPGGDLVTLPSMRGHRLSGQRREPEPGHEDGEQQNRTQSSSRRSSGNSGGG